MRAALREWRWRLRWRWFALTERPRLAWRMYKAARQMIAEIEHDVIHGTGDQTTEPKGILNTGDA